MAALNSCVGWKPSKDSGATYLVGQCWPTLGHRWPIPGQRWPISGQHYRFQANVGRFSANVAGVSEQLGLEHKLGFA